MKIARSKTGVGKIGNHQKKCKVCRSKYREEIEKGFLKGVSLHGLGRTYGISHQSISRHISVFNLRARRENSTLAVIERMIDRYDSHEREVSDSLLFKCLSLRVKLKGELPRSGKQRQAPAYDTDEFRAAVKKHVDKRMSNLANRLRMDEREQIEAGIKLK